MVFEILSVTSLVIACASLVFTIKLWIEHRARDLSTHSIQYVPVGAKVDADGFEIITDDVKKNLSKDDLDNIQ